MDNRLEFVVGEVNIVYLIKNSFFCFCCVFLFQMALKHHPDKNPNNPEATEKVSQLLLHKLDVTSKNVFRVSSGSNACLSK